MTRTGSLKRVAAVRAALLIAGPLVASEAAAFDARRADDSTVRVIGAIVKGDTDKVEPIFCCSTGTGFVIDEDHIATNHHVIELEEQLKKAPGARIYYIVRTAGSTKNLPAQVIWKSAELDLAVVRIPKLGKTPLSLSDSAMMDYPLKGQKVFAIGFPGVSDQALDSEEARSHSTVTQGVVGKTVRAPVGGKVRPVVQHDASINPGNSGGPLFDNCGVVVGVNTFVAVSRLQIMKDDQGRDIATGATAAGIFLSPHVGNLISSVKNVPELQRLTLRTTSATCADDGAGVPPWLYAVIAVFGLATIGGFAFVMTRRRPVVREVVRVVESYSAWVRRKGATPGAPRSGIPGQGPSPAAEPIAVPSARGRLDRPSDEPTAPPAAGDLTLSGFDSSGSTVRVAITKGDFEKAMSGAEKGVILGRSSSLSDKVLNDGSISRRHLKVARVGTNSFTVEDLQSAFGTKINEQPLAPFQPAPIKPGDKLTLGAVTFDLSTE